MAIEKLDDVKKPETLPAVQSTVFAAEVEFFGKNGESLPQVSMETASTNTKKAS